MRTLHDLPSRVTVYEVGPRDGLQNEPQPVASDVKIHYIDRLSEAGLPYIEMTSFVRPGAIPQLSDAEDVAARTQRFPGTVYTALVPNLRGMGRAHEARLGGVAVFTAASETFSRKNTNGSIAETLERFVPVIAAARSDALWTRGYVSTAFGCPYEGQVSAQAVHDVTRRLFALGVDEVALSDTIGVATPGDVTRLIEPLVEDIPAGRLALHLHDTRGTALANVLAGLQIGISKFDSSAGGLGGCPYAPGAMGNLATEDLIYMLHGLGIQTGVSLDGVVAASRYLAEATGMVPPSRYYRAAVA